MIEAPLAYAFTVGMLATVNPCGFAMLPAYLSYFIGLEGAPADTRASVGRALAVGGVVSLGFVLVFAVVGTLVRSVTSSLLELVPYVGLVIGLALAALGVAMLRGFRLTVALPHLDRGGRDRTMGSMFLFGVSYAVASLSCTISLFLVAVGTTFTTGNFVSGVAAFVAYAAGMGLVLTALTVALALARQSLLRLLRRALGHVDRAAAVLVIVAGVYITYYWSVALLTDPGDDAATGPAVFVEDLAARVGARLQEWGATRVGLVLAVALAAALAYVVGRRQTVDR